MQEEYQMYRKKKKAIFRIIMRNSDLANIFYGRRRNIETASDRSMKSGFGATTRTSVTELRYAKAVENMTRNKSLEDVVSEMKYPNNICRGTFRWRRCAINYVFEELNGTGYITDRLLTCHIELNKIDQKIYPKKTRSNRYEKNASREDIYQIVNRLLQMRCRYSVLSASLLFCNTHLGLRNIEWLSAEMSGVGPHSVLIVQNAKNTNGRGNGPQRNLRLSTLRQDIIDVINNSLAELKEFKKLYKKETILKGISAAINKANVGFFSKKTKRITLYTTRHYFAATAKYAYSQIGGPFAERAVAALMGHASDWTAYRCYARSKTYTGTYGIDRHQMLQHNAIPMPTDQDVATVRWHGAMLSSARLKGHCAGWQPTNSLTHSRCGFGLSI